MDEPDLGRRAPDELLGAVAEQRLAGGRHVQVAAVEVVAREAVARVLREHAVLGLAGRELGSRLDLGRDVLDRADEAAHAVRLGARDRREVQPRPARAGAAHEADVDRGRAAALGDGTRGRDERLLARGLDAVEPAVAVELRARDPVDLGQAVVRVDHAPVARRSGPACGGRHAPVIGAG